MREDRFLVLSSSSLGYELYSEKTKEVTLAKKRGRIDLVDKILIGDECFLDEEGFICSIAERRSLLKRPRLANCDEVFIIVSLTKPSFSSFLLDKFLTMVDYSSIKASIVLTKCDLLSEEELSSFRNDMSFYRKLGYNVYFVSALDRTVFDYALMEKAIEGKMIAFMGQTGVGKSTLLNLIDPAFDRKVDSLYAKVDRGRHTTKETIMVPYKDSFIYDTPGFSSFDLDEISLGELSVFFPGFEKHFNDCKFKDCPHLPNSPDCHIISLVNDGELSDFSYQNYLKIREEIKEGKKWKRRPR